MTKTEAAEIVMLGQYVPCAYCNETGYVSWPGQLTQNTCMSCKGVTFTLREGWYTAMHTLGLCVTVTRKDYGY